MLEEGQSVNTTEESVNLNEDKSAEISENARKEYLSRVKDTKEQVKQMGTETIHKTKQVIDEIGDYIKENPQKSSLISLGVGVGLGILLGWATKR